MGQIRWTDEASKWLQDIFDYINNENPDAASNVVRGIYDKVQLLKDYPELGYRYEANLEKPIRILLYGHYRIPYIILDNDNISIIGIFHGALNVERFLNDC